MKTHPGFTADQANAVNVSTWLVASVSLDTEVEDLGSLVEDAKATKETNSPS